MHLTLRVVASVLMWAGADDGAAAGVVECIQGQAVNLVLEVESAIGLPTSGVHQMDWWIEVPEQMTVTGLYVRGPAVGRLEMTEPGVWHVTVEMRGLEHGHPASLNLRADKVGRGKFGVREARVREVSQDQQVIPSEDISVLDEIEVKRASWWTRLRLRLAG